MSPAWSLRPAPTGWSSSPQDLGSSEFVSFTVKDAAGSTGGVTFLSANDNNSTAGTAASTFAWRPTPSATRVRTSPPRSTASSATTNGASAKLSTDFLDVEIDLTTAGSQVLGSIDAATITGGGANFNLGPNVDIGNQVSIGIGSVASRNLGDTATGFLSQLGSGQDLNVVDGDLSEAQKVVNEAISQVSTQRGRLGAFQKNVVGSTIRSLGVALENTSAAESTIRDTDFAKETAALTRSQILVQAATNSLGIANSQPQNALSLLR